MRFCKRLERCHQWNFAGFDPGNRGFWSSSRKCRKWNSPDCCAGRLVIQIGCSSHIKSVVTVREGRPIHAFCYESNESKLFAVIQEIRKYQQLVPNPHKFVQTVCQTNSDTGDNACHHLLIVGYRVSHSLQCSRSAQISILRSYKALLELKIGLGEATSRISRQNRVFSTTDSFWWRTCKRA